MTNAYLDIPLAHFESHQAHELIRHWPFPAGYIGLQR
jgi:hypothetical protein